MKICYKRSEEPRTIEEFANKNDLVMDVMERDGVPPGHPHRWYAHFRGFSTFKPPNGFLYSSGEGVGPSEAIEAYCKIISGEEIASDPPSGRIVLRVPGLLCTYTVEEVQKP